MSLLRGAQVIHNNVIQKLEEKQFNAEGLAELITWSPKTIADALEVPVGLVMTSNFISPVQKVLANLEQPSFALPSSSNLKRTAAGETTTPQPQQQKRTKALEVSPPTVGANFFFVCSVNVKLGPHADPLKRWPACISRDEHETRTVEDYNAMKHTKVVRIGMWFPRTSGILICVFNGCKMRWHGIKTISRR